MLKFVTRDLAKDLRCLGNYAFCVRDFASSQESAPSENNVKLPELKVPTEYRFMYPEFLPDPKIEWRNPIREKLERMDMIKRRAQIDIPEFYVGSVVSVTYANHHSQTKVCTFMGICIQKRGCGLRASFVLRNVIDNLGTEMEFHIYDPKMRKVEVIRLEKSIDDDMLYLRDALPEYSTFPLDMEPEILPPGAAVPINRTKVILKPRPWVARWERSSYEGIDREHMMTLISEKMAWQINRHQTPYEKYDLMKQYRATIPEEEQTEIYAEVYSQLHELEHDRKKMKRKKTFVKPKKVA